MSLYAPEAESGPLELELDKDSREQVRSSMQIRLLLFGIFFSCSSVFILFAAAARSFDLAASTTRYGASCSARVPCRTLSLSLSLARLATLLVTLPSAASGLVLHCQTGQEPQGQERGALWAFIGMPEIYCRHGRL